MSKAYRAILDAACKRQCEVNPIDDSVLEIIDVRRIRLRDQEKGIEVQHFDPVKNQWVTLKLPEAYVLADPDQSLSEALEASSRTQRLRTFSTP